MGMVSDAILDHDGDPASQMLIDALDGQCVVSGKRIETAANVQQWHITLDQLVKLHQAFTGNQRIVGVNAGNSLGVRGGPCECITASTAHTDKGGFFGKPMLFSEKRIPGIPVLDVVGLDEADVKATLEQLDLSLRLVIEIAASPGPRLALRCLLRNDDDAAQLPLHVTPFLSLGLYWALAHKFSSIE
jgi:hypothetical protein